MSGSSSGSFSPSPRPRLNRRLLTPLCLALLAALTLAPLLTMLALSAHGPAAQGAGAVWLGPWLRLARSVPILASR